MQNPSVARTRPRVAASPVTRLSWSFLFLVVVCACVVAVGFFFAARQHFTSMDYGIKNSKLREQLQNLETEKRRLMLAREVALSPLAIRKAAHNIGMRKSSEVAAVQVTAKAESKPQPITAQAVKAEAGKSDATRTVVKTSMTAPVQVKSSGETRSRIVDPSKKDRTEVAALLKLR